MFVTGLEEGLFPGRQKEDEDIEEERRISTLRSPGSERALSFLLEGSEDLGTPRSNTRRFIADIDPALIRVEGSPSFGDTTSFPRRNRRMGGAVRA